MILNMKHWVSVVVCAALAGCGGGDDGGTGTAASSSSGGGSTAIDGSTTAIDPTTGATTVEPTTSSGSASGTTTGTTTADTTTSSTMGTTTGDTSTSDTSTSTGPAPACGDLVVDPGEECDDGNQEDADACSNMCASASCGDGKTQAPEECDDGNKVDTDACLGTCLAAKCGDRVVQDIVEQCDDGNLEDLDGCSNLCVLPTCSDKLKNGAESDVDCGGAVCPKCGLGGVCGADSDCGVGVCLQQKCVSNKSCKALFDGDNALKDGKYMIDPDEGGPNPAFEAYCDMSHDGGGWTLIMKAVNTNFLYDDPLWENNLTLNPTDFDFVTDGKKAKYQTFLTVGFGELRSSTLDGASAHLQKLPAPVASATALFAGPGIEVNKTLLNAYFDNLSIPYDKHAALCNPSTKYVNYGINLKKINGVNALPDGGFCDWNGGARFGQRVNGNHNATGNHAGQGWGTYTTINANYLTLMKQLLWVR